MPPRVGPGGRGRGHGPGFFGGPPPRGIFGGPPPPRVGLFLGGPPPPIFFAGRRPLRRYPRVIHSQVYIVNTATAQPQQQQHQQQNYREVLPLDLQISTGGQLKRFFVDLPHDIEVGMSLPVLLDGHEFLVPVPDDARPSERIIVCVPLSAFQQSPVQSQPHIDGVSTVVRDVNKTVPSHLATEAYSVGSSATAMATATATAVAVGNSGSAACSACTFINPSGIVSCEMCGSPVGAGVGLPVATVFGGMTSGGKG